MSGGDFDNEARDEQTREEFEKAKQSAPTLEEARAWLKQREAEAYPDKPNGKIIFSPQYLAAAEVLYTEAPFEYRRELLPELEKRGYGDCLKDFRRKVRELQTEHKRQRKEQRSGTSNARHHNQRPDTADASQNGAGPNPATDQADNHPFIVRGFSANYRGRSYYYVRRATNALIELSRSNHRPPCLLDVAPLYWWEARFPAKAGVDWQAAASWLMDAGGAAGVFDPTQARRGIGLWTDEEHILFHKGDELIAIVQDGTAIIPLAAFDSAYIYEPRPRLKIDINHRASNEEAQQLITALEGFSWRSKLSPRFLAGGVAISPLAGALSFRPTLWITGAEQTGKSTVLQEIVIPALGGIGGHFVLAPSGSQTSEAFLRQSIDCDAKAIVFDEADRSDDSNHIVAIVNYIRGTNAAGVGVGKGGAGGTPLHFTGKPIAIIASISFPISEAADISRTIKFETTRPTLSKDSAVKYAGLRQSIREQITSGFGYRLIARSIYFAPTTLKNVDVYNKALVEAGYDARSADRLAPVMAGARSLTAQAGEVINAEDARERISKAKFGDFAIKTEDRAQHGDERGFWDHLITQRIRVDNIDYRVGELIDDLRNISNAGALLTTQALARHGIKFDDDGKNLCIARGKKAFADLLKDTKWRDNYYLHLNRLLEAAGLKSEDYTKQLRFKGIGQAYATVFPPALLDSLLGTRGDGEVYD